MELKHHYGANVHILDNTYLTSVLAKLCSPESYQPQINHYVETLYAQLLHHVMNQEFATEAFHIPTRMTEAHPQVFLHGERVQPQQRVVVVNLARAGIYPSHICYSNLHLLLNHVNIRQDHIFASRMTAENHSVTGTALGSAKIGGDVRDSLVLIPDPMGATGNTIMAAIDYYKVHVTGPAKKYIALHLIVTPEYLKRVTKMHPDAIIYALRVDRGLSSKDVLERTPGEQWDRERGLNDHDYIVPGGGGFGEIMNNSFV